MTRGARPAPSSPALSFLAMALLAAASCAPASAQPLRVGVVPGTPPFVTQDHARLTGFSIELFRRIAAGMKREVTFLPAPMAELEADLAAGKVDVLAGPIPATPERAASLLFTTGYLWTEYQFASRADQPLRSLADLRGRRLAVPQASEYAGWAERNAARYGFTPVLVPHASDTFEALRQNRADASLTGSPALAGALGPRPGGSGRGTLAAGLALSETRAQEAAAVAPANTELRDEIEDSLDCLKQNGTVAKLSQHWLGLAPGAEDLQVLVEPGHGVPGLAGYDAKPQILRCGP